MYRICIRNARHTNYLGNYNNLKRYYCILSFNHFQSNTYEQISIEMLTLFYFNCTNKSSENKISCCCRLRWLIGSVQNNCRLLQWYLGRPTRSCPNLSFVIIKKSNYTRGSESEFVNSNWILKIWSNRICAFYAYKINKLSLEVPTSINQRCKEGRTASHSPSPVTCVGLVLGRFQLLVSESMPFEWQGFIVSYSPMGWSNWTTIFFFGLPKSRF